VTTPAEAKVRRERADKLLRDGLTVKQTAAEMGMSKGAIQNMRTRYGIGPTRQVGASLARRARRAEEVKKLWAEHRGPTGYCLLSDRPTKSPVREATA
jgi:transposase